MADLPEDCSSLELTISVRGFSPPPSSKGVRDLDINRVPASVVTEGFQWMALASGGIMMTEEYEEEDQGESNGVDEGVPPRKKLRLSKEQSLLLEESFRQNHTLNPKQKEALATQLKLKPRQVEVWFQNRRSRSKLKQTEIECEYLKRCFGSLTEQNRQLLREVEELRALKIGHPTDDLLPTSNSLTMCPRCDCITSDTIKGTRKPAVPDPR